MAALSQSSEDHKFEEWEKSREVIAKFDELNHDIRKYGVTFVAGLLAAESFIFSTDIPRLAKLAGTMGTLVLIVALRITEKDYELFQRAAASRANLLEGELGLGLTKAISKKYQAEGMWRYVDAVYSAMALVAGALGYFILSPAAFTPSRAAIVDLVATGLSVAWIVYIGPYHTRAARKRSQAPDTQP